MSIIFSDNFPGDGLIDKSKWKFNVWTPPNRLLKKGLVLL
jgi:hypothetical protein